MEYYLYICKNSAAGLSKHKINEVIDNRSDKYGKEILVSFSESTNSLNIEDLNFDDKRYFSIDFDEELGILNKKETLFIVEKNI